MIITSIQVALINSETKLVGTANIVLDNMIVIKDIKILYNDGLYFLAMPSKPTKNGTFKDMVHPINEMVRSLFEKTILFAFKKAVETGYNRISMEIRDVNVQMHDFIPEEYEITYSANVPCNISSKEKTDNSNVQLYKKQHKKSVLKKNKSQSKSDDNKDIYNDSLDDWING